MLTGGVIGTGGEVQVWSTPHGADGDAVLTASRDMESPGRRLQNHGPELTW